MHTHHIPEQVWQEDVDVLLLAFLQLNEELVHAVARHGRYAHCADVPTTIRHINMIDNRGYYKKRYLRMKSE